MEQLLDFVRDAAINSCDLRTVATLQDAVVDLFACTIAGSRAPVSQIVQKFAKLQFGNGECTVFMSSDKLKPAGSALVNATMANSLDIDDGHRLTKGHPGAAVFPAILAAAESIGCSGRTFLDALLIGYEIAIRAGILAHRLRPEYHCTGSWGALGAAAGVCKLLGSSSQVIEHALGIAEYHSTYSPMMRCIDVPSMLKDGIGWGSMVGVSSAYLADEGFTGIPSMFSFSEAEDMIAELGKSFRINELYFKPYACCRWAQPAIEAMKLLQQEKQIGVDSIESITIHTFEESSRLIRTYPNNTEEAQYNLLFPLAAYLAYGRVGAEEVLNGLSDPSILKYMDLIKVSIDPEIDAKFPLKALSRLEIKLTNGNKVYSENVQAGGDYDNPLTDEEKRDKYYRLTRPVLGGAGSRELYDRLRDIAEVEDIRTITALIRHDSIFGE